MERIPDATLSTLRKHIPHIIFIDNYDLEHEFDCIGFDHYSANWQVMHCLINHGYQRIALISGTSPNEPLSDTFRLLCYREALRRAGIPFDSNLVKDCLWDMELCARQTRELMSLPEPPEVIFAGSDSLASSVLSTIYSMGLRCPDDVGVIGFNNIPLSAHMVPPLTTVSIPTRDIGIAAVQRMMELVRGKGGAKRKILFPTRLMERQSLKRVTK